MNQSFDTPSSNRTPDHGPDRVRWLREQIAELKKSWPAHSVPPSLLQRLEDLEEELDHELRRPGKAVNGSDWPQP